MTILDQAFFRLLELEFEASEQNLKVAVNAHIQKFIPLNDLSSYNAYILHAEISVSCGTNIPLH
jgi:hypothetical protein